MELHGSERSGGGQTGGKPFRPDHTNQTAGTSPTAVQPGPSRPGAAPESTEAPKPCECGFCDGVTVEHESVNLHTGAVETESFERMSRRPRCPNCGGRNAQYRRSYTAHAADLARRLGARKCDVYAVTVTLDAKAVERAGLDGEATYKVWTGDGAPWSRARRAVKRRDAAALYLGTLSARPSDGTYHLHIVLVTRLSVADLREAFHVAGLDAYVQTPKPNESAEGFTARKAAYAFDNAAHGPSARFVSSRGNGAGYDSETAVRRRREAAKAREESREENREENREGGSCTENQPEAGSPPRGALEETSDATGEETEANSGHEVAQKNHVTPESTGTSGDRAPPVHLGGQTYRDREAYMRAVKRGFSRRVGSAVHVVGMGPADLLKVSGADTVECVVHPEVGTEAVTVDWTEVRVKGAPLLRRSSGFAGTSTNPNRSMRKQTDSSDTSTEDDPVQRFNEAAETSRVTVELDDGRRRVTEKNHRTGETRQYVKPPRNEYR